MTDVPAHGRLVGFHSLPTEIRYQIFEYIYPPWHFEYTQIHDLFLTSDQEYIKEIFHRTTTGFTSTPRFSKLPSIAPLLACKDFHNAGRYIFDSSFTGHMHVISGMMWKEVHWTYAAIMAKATTLTIHICQLQQIYLCKILDRLPNLKNVIVSTTFDDFRELCLLSCRRVNCEVEATRASDRLVLEGSEFTEFLPADFDLSDTALQRFWNESALQIRSPHGHDVTRRRRVDMNDKIRDILCPMGVNIICRSLIEVPVLPEYADQGISVYSVSDFICHCDR